MKNRSMLLGVALVLAMIGLSQVRAVEGGSSRESDWGKLNTAKKRLLATNHFLSMSWLEDQGRLYELKDLPAALEIFQQAVEYRDHYQDDWPSVD